MFISEEAREQLRALPDELRKNIGYRLHLLQQEFSGEIKSSKALVATTGFVSGGTESSFAWTPSLIEVYAVKQRKDAYD